MCYCWNFTIVAVINKTDLIKSLNFEQQPN